MAIFDTIMATLFLLAALFVANLFLLALFFWLGARWVKASRASFPRAAIVTVILSVVGVLFLLASAWLQARLEREDARVLLGAEGALLLGQLFVSWLVIAGLMRTTLPRAILVWLMSMIGVVSGLAIVFLIVRPYVLEAFIVPTNSMAPTVIGWHRTGVCPACQGLLIVPAQPPEEQDHLGEDPDLRGICAACWKTSKAPANNPAADGPTPPDRILVNKLLTPQRWSLIVFRYPKKPSVKYMMRLVGLPGETVYLKEGALLVNSVKVELPTELTGLRYGTEIGGMPISLGTPENPWRLGNDEYVVLGDFSERSSDSRFWGPVPGSHLEGVVSLCYWPVSRWRVFR